MKLDFTLTLHMKKNILFILITTSACFFNYTFAQDCLDANDNGICDVNDVFGCTVLEACNYNAEASFDDGSCNYIWESINSCIDSNLGCIDNNACNYDDTADLDNDSCIYPQLYYNCLGVCVNDADNDGVCDELEILGCTDPTAFNYESTATDDDNSCVPFLYGCTDPAALNYDSLANTDDDSCMPFIYGCTDPTAFNYDSLANTDDG